MFTHKVRFIRLDAGTLHRDVGHIGNVKDAETPIDEQGWEAIMVPSLVGARRSKCTQSPVTAILEGHSYHPNCATNSGRTREERMVLTSLSLLEFHPLAIPGSELMIG